MLASQARRFGETLVERHVLSRDDLEHALEEAQRVDEPLPAVLLRRGLVGSKDLTAALAEHLGIRFVDFLDTPIHQDAPSLVSADLARRHLALPVDFEGTRLVVAFAEPADDQAVAAIGAATGYEIIPAVADRAELVRALDMIFGAAGDPHGAGTDVSVTGEAPAIEAEDLHVNDLLELVLHYRGSDLHLTSGAPPVVRVHGELLPMTHLPVLNGSQIRQMIYSVISQKQRELCAVASLTVLHRPRELRAHIHAALNVGATRQEVAEVIFQQVTYGGMPVVVDALDVYGEVLRERGAPYPGEEEAR